MTLGTLIYILLGTIVWLWMVGALDAYLKSRAEVPSRLNRLATALLWPVVATTDHLTHAMVRLTILVVDTAVDIITFARSVWRKIIPPKTGNGSG